MEEGAVALSPYGLLDAASVRRFERRRLVPAIVVRDKVPPVDAIPFEEMTVAAVEGESVYPVLRDVLVAGERCDVEPRGLTPTELEAVARDEILCPLEARGGLRNAEVVAWETWRMARSNPRVTEEERELLVRVCVDGRVAIWVDGVAFSYIKGCNRPLPREPINGPKNTILQKILLFRVVHKFIKQIYHFPYDCRWWCEMCVGLYPFTPLHLYFGLKKCCEKPPPPSPTQPLTPVWYHLCPTKIHSMKHSDVPSNNTV